MSDGKLILLFIFICTFLYFSVRELVGSYASETVNFSATQQ